MVVFYSSLPIELKPAFLLNTEKANSVIGQLYQSLEEHRMPYQEIESLIASHPGAADQIVASTYLEEINLFNSERNGSPLEATVSIREVNPRINTYEWVNGQVPEEFFHIHFYESAERLTFPLHQWIDITNRCRNMDQTIPREGEFISKIYDEGGSFPDSYITVLDRISDNIGVNSRDSWELLFVERGPIDTFLTKYQDPAVLPALPLEVQTELLNLAGVFNNLIDALDLANVCIF